MLYCLSLASLRAANSCGQVIYLEIWFQKADVHTKRKWNREGGKEPIQAQIELATIVENWCLIHPTGIFCKGEKMSLRTFCSGIKGEIIYLLSPVLQWSRVAQYVLNSLTFSCCPCVNAEGVPADRVRKASGKETEHVWH